VCLTLLLPVDFHWSPLAEKDLPKRTHSKQMIRESDRGNRTDDPGTPLTGGGFDGSDL